MKKKGWAASPTSASAFLHGPTRAIMVVYVDDMILLAKPKDVGSFWRLFDKSVHFKDSSEMPLKRYLVARYQSDEFDNKKQHASRSLRNDTDQT